MSTQIASTANPMAQTSFGTRHPRPNKTSIHAYLCCSRLRNSAAADCAASKYSSTSLRRRLAMLANEQMLLEPSGSLFRKLTENIFFE